MNRKDLEYLNIAAMLLTALYVTVTGLVAGFFGVHQVFLHRYAGYACAALAALHLILKRRQVTAYLKQRLGRPEAKKSVEPTQRDRAPLLGRRGFLASALAAAGGFALGRVWPARQPIELPGEATDVGELYHQWSRPGYGQVVGTVTNWGEWPGRYKTHDGAERITLPHPLGFQGLSFEEAVETRRSVRSYSGESLSQEALSRLLHAAQGVTKQAGMFRAAPSAGALYPIELYAVVHDVTGLAQGIYHYAVRKHELESLQPGDFRAAVTQAGLWQGFLGGANVCFILTAIFQRTRWRYHERAYRYVMLEAGHVGQNLYLAATSMGLGACAVGAFLDDQLDGLLGVDGKEEATLYVVSVGTV
jgi:SagB-type dehydrogenase family enzyme